MKSILHIANRALPGTGAPLPMARASALVVLTALLCACSSGSSWRSSSAMGHEDRTKVSRSSAPAAQAESAPAATHTAGSSSAATTAPTGSSALETDKTDVVSSGSSTGAESNAPGEQVASRPGGQDETANVQSYHEPDAPAARESDSGRDAAADAGGPTAASAAPTDASRSGSGDSGANAANAGTGVAESAANATAGAGDGADRAAASPGSAAAGTAAARDAGEGAEPAAGASASAGGNDAAGATADKGGGSPGTESTGSSAAGTAAAGVGTGTDTQNASAGAGDSSARADVAAVSPAQQQPGTASSNELPSTPGNIGDTNAGAGQTSAAAKPPAIVGVVEAPGEKASSKEMVMPQTLGGMLPMTIGVDGEGEFDFDKALLRNETKALLDQLASKLKEAEYDQLQIVGHTDRIGSEEYNQYLSERRAWAVARYLVKQGVPVTKLKVVGKGMYQPLTTADECVGLDRERLIACVQKDRRVEISASIRRTDVDVR